VQDKLPAGVWGCPPVPKIPPDWGIKGVEIIHREEAGL
jgi:hypothetical protein